MKALTAFFLFATLSSPAVAANQDHGIIVTKGDVVSSCSIGADLRMDLERDGSTKLKTSGTIALSQTATTTWELKKTVQEQGTNYSTKVDLDAGRLQLSSTNSSGETKKITGSLNETADVDVVLTAVSGDLAAGSYQTKTEIKCVVGN